MSAPGRLNHVTTEQLDTAWAANARATVLLTQAFAKLHDDSRPNGRVLLFTSGQHLAPMSDELPNTGWPTNQLREQLRPAFPTGRWGQPHDIARIAAWLTSPDSTWITGQVINAEGGFRRSTVRGFRLSAESVPGDPIVAPSPLIPAERRCR